MKLYRGDTRQKGEEFKANPDYIINGEAKNKAGYHFFTPHYQDAVNYATTAMNDKIRGNGNHPNITTVEFDGVNSVDFRPAQDKAWNAQDVWNKLKDVFWELTFEDFCMLIRGTTDFPFEQDSATAESQFKALEENQSPMFSISLTKMTNDNAGVYFKKMLDEKGVDLIMFHDTMGGQDNYCFTNASFEIISNEKI